MRFCVVLVMMASSLAACNLVFSSKMAGDAAGNDAAAIDARCAGPFVDSDSDGVADPCDNCQQLPNPAQLDEDLDGIGDVCDNCVGVANPEQMDGAGDADGVGEACDPYPNVPTVVVAKFFVEGGVPFAQLQPVGNWAVSSEKAAVAAFAPSFLVFDSGLDGGKDVAVEAGFANSSFVVTSEVGVFLQSDNQRHATAGLQLYRYCVTRNAMHVLYLGYQAGPGMSTALSPQQGLLQPAQRVLGSVDQMGNISCYVEASPTDVVKAEYAPVPAAIASERYVGVMVANLNAEVRYLVVYRPGP